MLVLVAIQYERNTVANQDVLESPGILKEGEIFVLLRMTHLAEVVMQHRYFGCICRDGREDSVQII